MLIKVSQESLDKVIEQNSLYLSRIKDLENLNQTYIEILEKTNSQLGLWTNPYGLMVGALSFLVALLAIAAGVFIWWQSSENKKMLKEALDKQMKEIKSDAAKEINNLIEETEKTVKESSGMLKIQAEKVVSELKNKKKLFESEIQINSLAGKYMKEEDYVCRNCRMFSGGGGGGIISYSNSHIPFNTLNLIDRNGKVYSNFNKNHCIRCGNLID